jgi:RNA polymerase subunit RPABC4/transcription elongation factor Spt4
MCDACGRLFVKGKYCPICLKASLHSQDYVRTMLFEF